jgi:hypothetical protein
MFGEQTFIYCVFWCFQVFLWLGFLMKLVRIACGLLKKLYTKKMKKKRRIIVLKVLARWWREFSFYTVAGIWVFFIPDLHDPRWSVKSGFEGTYFHRRFLRIAQDRLPAEILQVDIYLFSGTHCENKCFSQLWNVACFFFFFLIYFLKRGYDLKYSVFLSWQ